jgi:hypothetical protein
MQRTTAFTDEVDGSRIQTASEIPLGCPDNALPGFPGFVEGKHLQAEQQNEQQWDQTLHSI